MVVVRIMPGSPAMFRQSGHRLLLWQWWNTVVQEGSPPGLWRNDWWRNFSIWGSFFHRCRIRLSRQPGVSCRTPGTALKCAAAQRSAVRLWRSGDRPEGQRQWTRLSGRRTCLLIVFDGGNVAVRNFRVVLPDGAEDVQNNRRSVDGHSPVRNVGGNQIHFTWFTDSRFFPDR